MDLLRIKRFQSIDKARYTEQQLKKIGPLVILTSLSELYVSTEHIETTIRVLGLPHDIADTKEPGPWCPQCSQQLVSRKNNARFFSSSENLYCYKCNE
jgi:hypothetical protein